MTVTGTYARWRAEARQRRQHREFRIEEPLWGKEERERLRELVTQVSTALAAAERQSATAGTGSGLSESDLATAATALWRARKRLDGADDRAARQAGRLLAMSQESLEAAGVAVQDHDGTLYDSGLALEVLVFQDEPGFTAERVVETVRPSVYLADRRIQMGQVIVGCPVAPGNTEDRNARHH
ncbi:hypothetical protein [Amycolatopsis saalfeldensis]|uniref:Molecular chaperone GrpE (Heat shock protein) n=1 Tax=Amycolatopsis saalfeldensis TaxID=394193 RepID=A0A1H8RBX0_9PSEU|nr:hypothetical protein [Amycolatopsis saalfeldensis]SEO63483.1 hypothetical protein SAMN04489732_101704 [Amycolatopsis saalfeldensis]